MRKVTTREYMLPFVLTLVFGTLFDVLILPVVTYSGAQKYRDFIYGLAGYNTNKSAELTLFKLSLVVICVLSLIIMKRIERDPKPQNLGGDESRCQPMAIYFILALNFGFYCLLGQFNEKIIVASLFYFFCYCLFPKEVNIVFFLGICSYYTVTAYISTTTILTQWTDWVFWKNISQMEIYVLTAVLVLAVICIWKRTNENYLRKIVLAEQIVIPMNFLVYRKNLYLYGEKTYNISFPIVYKWSIVAICLLGVVMAILHYRTVKSQESWEKLIALSTIISIFVMNSYIVPANIVPSDFWHHGEQVTAWKQIFHMGQGLYTDFFPSSGIFSIPIGILIDLFGGKATAYAAAYSFIAMIVAIVTVVFFKIVGDEKIALVIALGTGTYIYNRGLLILPYLLVLTLPKLVNNKSAWIKTWILASMICGIYYPAIGIPLLIATIPFGIIQIIAFWKKEWPKKRYQIVFWSSWIVVFISVALCSKMLVNMMMYILSLAGQSLEADSFTLLAYAESPLYFFPFLGEGVRYVLYLFFRLLLSGIAVVMPATLFFVCIKRDGRHFWESPMSLALSASMLFMTVYYSYSLLRADTGVMVSRTGVGIFNISVYMLIVMYKYGDAYLTRKLKYQLTSVLFSVAAASFAYSGLASFPQVDMGVPTGGIHNDANRLVPIYDIDNSQYIYTQLVDEDARKWIGNGFISNDNYNEVLSQKQFIEQYGLENEYFVNMPRFDYFLLNTKAAYVDSTNILQSKKAQEKMIECINDKNPIFTSCSAIGNYELLKWMQNKKYVQLNNGWYVSPQTVQSYNLEKMVVCDKVNSECGDYGRSTNAFGKSFVSLEKIYEREKNFDNQYVISAVSGLESSGDRYVINNPEEAIFRIIFPEAVDGEEYDYIYLKLRTNIDFSKEYNGTLDERIQKYYGWNEKLDMNRLMLYWQDENGNYNEERSSTMSLQTGELLIPIGYNSSWKNCKHSEIQIRINGNFVYGTEMELESVRVMGR